MDLYRNPETEPQNQDIEIRGKDPADWGGSRFNIAGPGGTTINLENNERGILDHGLFSIIEKHRYAALSSDHDSQRQGIYATNSVGDND